MIMPTRIAVNSKSTGKFKTVVINNRPHLSTEMVSIVGDSVMNGLLYPLNHVATSFAQLDQLPAPASHPTVNGQNVSAFHPLAVNAHNFGGMVRAPRMDGKKVINELVIDIEVANKDERGKEIVRRIEAGESIGVSTGLNATVTNQSGKEGDKEYKGIVSEIKFDHVAVLPDETPAGSDTFTINSDELMICNVAESVSDLEDKVSKAVDAKFSTTERHAWASDILFSPDRAVVRLQDKLMMIPFGYDDNGEVVFTGEGVEVVSKRIYETVGTSTGLQNQEEDEMDKEKIVLAIIGNAANAFTGADKDSLMAMSESDLVNSLHTKTIAPPVTVDVAKKAIEDAGLTVNAADFNKDHYKSYIDNKPAFDEFLGNKAEGRDKMVESIVTNSKMTKEQVEAMPDDTIESLANSFGGTQDYSVNSQSLANNDRAPNGKEVDFSH
jgi:hypothetical protein